MMVRSSPSGGSLESTQRKLARSNIHASTAALRASSQFAAVPTASDHARLVDSRSSAADVSVDKDLIMLE